MRRGSGSWWRSLGLVSLAAIMCTPIVAQNAPTLPLPIEAFAQLPQVDNPKLSPDGNRIAAKVAIDGRQYFVVVFPESNTPRKLITTGKADLNWWRWVNNDWLVIGVGQELATEGGTMYVTRAVAYQVSTEKMLPIAEKAAQSGDDVIWTATDGSARLLLAYQGSIYVNNRDFWPKVDDIDLDSGKCRTVVSGHEGVFNWYADGKGVVRMGVGRSDDGRSSRLLYRDRDGATFRTIDRAKSGRDEKLTVPSLFLGDGGKALVIADDEGGYSALYEFDLSTLQRGAQLFATKGYDIGGIAPNNERNALLGVYVDQDRPGVYWTDPAMAAFQAKVSGLVKGGQARIVSMNKDRSRAIIAIEGANTPGANFLYYPDQNAVALVGYNNPGIEMRRMHPVRTIRYKARDGLEIPAVLPLPTGRKVGQPLIVMPHGGPFARDSETWDWRAQYLADRGYAVIQPNYRGSSGYGTPFTDKGEGQWGLAMQDDLNDAVTALTAQGIVDPKRVCMVGASYGGYAALRAAQRDGATYRCAVSYAGVSDLDRMQRYQGNFLFAGARQDWLTKQAPDLKAVSPVNFAAEFSIPVLLIHGEEDRVVPAVQSKIMAERLKRAGKNVIYIVQPNADHHFSRSEDRLEFLKTLDAFLKTHNPA